MLVLDVGGRSDASQIEIVVGEVQNYQADTGDGGGDVDLLRETIPEEFSVR